MLPYAREEIIKCIKDLEQFNFDSPIQWIMVRHTYYRQDSANCGSYSQETCVIPGLLEVTFSVCEVSSVESS